MWFLWARYEKYLGIIVIFYLSSVSGLYVFYQIHQQGHAGSKLRSNEVFMS